MSRLVYFSSVSGNTHRFVEGLGRGAQRIPLMTRDDTVRATEPYVLVLPTYGGDGGARSVPKQVIKFLNDEKNRHLLRGVIVGGNTNFGAAYGIAGDVVAAKCSVPLLYRFELFGTPDDIRAVNDGLDAFWNQQSQNSL